MTNTLHRKGHVEDLKKDYVIFTSVDKSIKLGSAPKIHEFLRICNKYNPNNIGSSKYGKTNIVFKICKFTCLIGQSHSFFFISIVCFWACGI